MTEATVPCHECSDPVPLEDAHNPHVPDCTGHPCICDEWVHPECCHECREASS